MELIFPALWQKGIRYIKNNIGVCIFSIFLFAAGTATGMSIVQSHNSLLAQKELMYIPALLHNRGIPWFSFIIISLAVNLIFICMHFLSGLWLPASFLWILSIFLRGMIIGTGLGASFSAWPSTVSVVLLLLLWVETAFLLPVLVRMSVLCAKQIGNRLSSNSRLSYGVQPEKPFHICYLKAAIGIIPCIIIEVFIMPVAIYLFC